MLFILVAVPLVYMVIVVVNGYLVEVNDIPGRTHYLYYEGDKLIALVTYIHTLIFIVLFMHADLVHGQL